MVLRDSGKWDFKRRAKLGKIGDFEVVGDSEGFCGFGDFKVIKNEGRILLAELMELVIHNLKYIIAY